MMAACRAIAQRMVRLFSCGARKSDRGLVASVTTQLTAAIAHHGVAAVFALMAVDAIFPVGSELVMLFAGAYLAHSLGGYVGLASAGTLGYLAGAVAGWAIGAKGGRALITRHGRWLHLAPGRLERAEAWFERFGPLAVFLGRITPLVRSFVSIPAGVLRSPFGPYVALTLAGSALWCFAFAGVGYAVGSSWESVHHAFRYADYAVVALAVVAVGVLIDRHWSRRSVARPPAGGL
jgi:membrane protein DedA with SNARE-associated domain